MLHNLFDSHGHYDSSRFDEDRHFLLPTMAENGIRALMNIGNSAESTLPASSLRSSTPSCTAP